MNVPDQYNNKKKITKNGQTQHGSILHMLPFQRLELPAIPPFLAVHSQAPSAVNCSSSNVVDILLITAFPLVHTLEHFQLVKCFN